MTRMRIMLRPVGRGNWQPLVLVIESGQELFPEALRDGQVMPEHRWTIFGRLYRVVRVELL